MTLPSACSYLTDNGTPCNREPVSADFFLYDDIRGSVWVASLCGRHDGARARSFALARGYDRRDRKTGLTAVQGAVA